MKYKSLFIIAILFAFLSIVKADDSSCDVKTEKTLMNLASDITINYEIGTESMKFSAEESAINGLESYNADYIYIKVYNLSSKLRIKGTNLKDGTTFDFNYRYIGSDGAVTLKRLVSSNITNYTFDVYGIDDCSSTKLRTFKLTVPRYNYLADTEICSDVQDYYLCQPLVTYEIDDDVAYKQIESYVEKVNNESDEEVTTGSSGATITKNINKLSNKKKYVVLSIVLVGALITLLLLKRKRSDR